MRVPRKLLIKLGLLFGLVLTGIALFSYTAQQEEYWAIWLVSAGLYLGILIIPGDIRFAAILASVGITIVLTLIVWQALPIHSLNLTNVTRVEIRREPTGKAISVIDPERLKQFEHFSQQGAYAKMYKCGKSYQLCIWQGSSAVWYYLHGETLGQRPGGEVQMVFVPTTTGLGDWVEETLKQHE